MILPLQLSVLCNNNHNVPSGDAEKHSVGEEDWREGPQRKNDPDLKCKNY